MADLKDRGPTALRDRSCSWPLLGCATIVSLAGGCMAEPSSELAGDGDRGGLEQVSSELFVEEAGIWPDAVIPVCFEASTFSNLLFATYRDQVRAAITSSWEAETSLAFAWKGSACAAGESGIHVTFFTPSSMTIVNPPCGSSKANGCAFQGRHRINGVADGMKLKVLDSKSDPAFARTAAHEFGHALGFAHEHLRQDKPSECTFMDQNPRPGDRRVGAFDDQSIMANGTVCSTANDSLSLSASDIAGAQRYYGAVAQVGFAPNVPSQNQWTVGVRGSAPNFEFLYRADSNGNGFNKVSNDRHSGTAALMSWEPGRLDTFWRRPFLPDDSGAQIDPSQDGAWMHRYQDPSGAAGEHPLAEVPARMRGNPVGLALGVNELEVWGRLNSGLAGRLTYRANRGWVFHAGIGGNKLLGDLALAVVGNRVFVYGRDSNNHLMHGLVDRNDPDAAIVLSDVSTSTVIASSPAVVTFTSNSGLAKMAVFAKGAAGNVLQWTCSPNVFDCAGPFNKGGVLYGAPTAVVDANNNQSIRVFGRGTNNRVYLMNCQGRDTDLNCGLWNPPTELFDQTITGSPSAFRTGTGEVVFARNPAGNLLVSLRNSSAAGSGWLNFSGFYR